MNNTLTPPHGAPAGYVWREAHGGGVYLAHESAEPRAGVREGDPRAPGHRGGRDRGYGDPRHPHRRQER